MAILQWRWIPTAGVVLAAGLTGAGQAQEPQRITQLPSPRIQQPAIQISSYEQCSPPSLSLWQRMKNRLEQKHNEPDPDPLGQSVYQNFTAQVNNGIAARMILYDFDFEGTELSPRGQDQLSQVIAWAMRNPYPVIIERNRYQPKVAEERRLAVLKELGSRGVPLAPDRIMVGMPLTPGLAGIEAWYQYNNLLLQTQSTGYSIGGANPGTGIPGTLPSPPTQPNTSTNVVR